MTAQLLKSLNNKIYKVYLTGYKTRSLLSIYIRNITQKLNH
jgi:hypothetical protein